jgi:phosphoribosyl-AMP cyclohydrolase / phosphoribosyl-ATP pyrophosphohydrolase
LSTVTATRFWSRPNQLDQPVTQVNGLASFLVWMKQVRCWERAHKTRERACFFTRLDDRGLTVEEKTQDAAGGIFESVLRTILARRANPQAGSYTTKLFEGGHDKILKKVAEEAGEVLLASKGGKKEEIVYEVADLFFHTLMVLGYHGLSLQDIHEELGRRFGKSGLRSEK